jgi:pyridoxamine 5'-phosphate oxidase family protein
MTFTPSELAYLRSQPLGRLATQQQDGTLQNSPVTFTYNPATDTIDIAGHRMGSSQKLRNIAANGRVAFVVDDLASTNPWRPRFLEIRGWAQAVTTDRAPASTPVVAGPFIRVHPTRILAFGLDAPDPRSSTLNGLPFNARDVEDPTHEPPRQEDNHS